MAAGPNLESRKFNHFSEIAGFIWQVADLLRGDYKQSDYGKVILPFTVLRRLNCVLEPTKAKVTPPVSPSCPRCLKNAASVGRPDRFASAAKCARRRHTICSSSRPEAET